MSGAPGKSMKLYLLRLNSVFTFSGQHHFETTYRKLKTKQTRTNKDNEGIYLKASCKDDETNKWHLKLRQDF